MDLSWGWRVILNKSDLITTSTKRIKLWRDQKLSSLAEIGEIENGSVGRIELDFCLCQLGSHRSAS